MSRIEATIVADSINHQNDRLTSILVTMPRIILSEMNTHRMLSKNTSSSRAIPFKKMVEAVQNNPFIPIAWQKHHSGMQGNEYHTGEGNVGDINYKARAERNWLRARDFAVEQAKHLYEDSLITKQLCNRLLEPFMWTTMLITGSKEGWDNFFELRCPQYEYGGLTFKSQNDCYKHFSEHYPKDAEYLRRFTELDWLSINKGQAEIHIMDLAEKIYDAMRESTPRQLKSGEWHIPFEDKIQSSKIFDEVIVEDPFNGISSKVKISTAMAARTSYTVVGDEKEIDYKKMIELHDRLLAQNPPHSSPMEHCARAMSDEEYYSFIKGKGENLRIEEFKTGMYNIDLTFSEDVFGWCRNFKGFIPYRHIVETN